MADTPEKQDREQFLATARKRFDAAMEDERELRAKFVDDLRFASPDGDDQWDVQLKQQREAAGRPAMSFPRGHIFVQQVANQARQQKPQIKYAPALGSDKDTAEVIEGIARKIQYDSQAQIAYENAIEYSAGASFGYYRILTDYADYDSDDQDIKILPVLDPLTVVGVLVPAIFGRKPKFWFVIEDIPKDEYKAQYGETEMASLDWTEAARRSEGWAGSETVRIAEYWTVEEKKVKGQRRPQCTIKFCKINGLEVLPDSETEWPGTICNIIPVLGKQMIKEGKPKLFSVVRPQKYAQQLINYSKSRIAETLATAPISPFMVANGQIPADKRAQWEELNRTVRPFIEYEPVDAQGRPVPPPQRQTFEPPIQSLSAFVAQEIDDMKATTGIFDASLGAQANETSGQAIMRRQQQADMSTMHYLDNLERSFKQAGDVIAELIPVIYDTKREITILGTDEAQKIVTINAQHTDASGKPKHYNVANFKGKYVVTMGKAYSSKRAESFDTMAQIIQTAPNMFPIMGDIMLRNSDMAGADEAADRLHAMLPPALQKNENNPMPPEAQQAVAHAQQQMQLMGGELQKLQFERAAKVAEHQGKLQQINLQSQADMALEKMKLENALAIAEVETKAQNVNERLAAVEDMMRQFHAQAHDVAMQKDQQAHEAQQQALAAQQQQALAAQNAQAASAQSAQDAAQSQAAQQSQPQQQ